MFYVETRYISLVTTLDLTHSIYTADTFHSQLINFLKKFQENSIHIVHV